MLNSIYYVIIMILSLTFSVGCINYSGVHRTFQLVFKGLIESSIVIIGEEEGNYVEPYFNEEVLVNYLSSYFEENIKRYVSNYEASYYFFNQESGLICTNHQCSALKVSLKADFNYFFHYEKAKNYYIVEGKLTNG